MSMVITKSMVTGEDIFRYDVDEKTGENLYRIYRHYYHGLRDDANLTKEEKRVIEDFIEDMDNYCGHRFQMPFIHKNSLVWVGTRWVRFTMVNGWSHVVNRGQPSMNDDPDDPVFGEHPIY